MAAAAAVHGSLGFSAGAVVDVVLIALAVDVLCVPLTSRACALFGESCGRPGPGMGRPKEGRGGGVRRVGMLQFNC